MRGIIPPLVTPFDDRDEVDEGRMREVIRFVLRAGVHGIAVCGSTGEGHTLTPEETRRIADITAEEVEGRIPLIIGVIANSVRQALRHAEAVRDLPVAALMVTPPHYLFSPDDREMSDYFRTIAEETGRPILIYNVVPWAYLSPEALRRLMEEVPGIIGVKQSAGDIHALAHLLSDLPDGKVILTALDDLLYPSFILGAQGAIAGICTAVPSLCLRLWEATHKGDPKTALKLHHQLLQVHTLLNGPNFPTRVKAFLDAQGVSAGRPRRPLRPLPEPERQRIRALVHQLGLA